MRSTPSSASRAFGVLLAAGLAAAAPVAAQAPQPSSSDGEYSGTMQIVNTNNCINGAWLTASVRGASVTGRALTSHGSPQFAGQIAADGTITGVRELRGRAVAGRISGYFEVGGCTFQFSLPRA